MHYRIQGIPCQVELSVSGRYVPAKVNADPDDCYEAEYPEVELTVLDRRGYPAPWLAAKMTSAEEDKIVERLLKEREAES